MLIKRKKKRCRLTWELTAMTVFSLMAGVLAARLVEDVILNYWMAKFNQEDYYEKQVEECLVSLRQFIEDNQVTEDNIELLIMWEQAEKNTYAVFYRDVETLIGPYADLGSSDSVENSFGDIVYYDVVLADGTPIKAELECFLDPGMFYGMDIAGYCVGGLVFILLLFGLIHRKIRYINRLEQELKILGSGNLEYPMTIRGNDEITSLAEGIATLKDGILEQQLMKDEAERANTELVTAMSHDLRTPLTSLIGYLELLTMKRYDSEEQLQNYLVHCREKAFQMKKMSDRLFEYFLVYGKQERPYQLQEVTCEELLEDLCNGQFFDWQEQGGTLECSIGALAGKVCIDGDYLQRVVDNMLSNLKKYADISRPLAIRAFEREDMLHILLTNFVREQRKVTESTQIGLKSCRKIIEKHGGTFAWRTINDQFEITMKLPLKKE